MKQELTGEMRLQDPLKGEEALKALERVMRRWKINYLSIGWSGPWKKARRNDEAHCGLP